MWEQEHAGGGSCGVVAVAVVGGRGHGVRRAMCQTSRVVGRGSIPKGEGGGSVPRGGLIGVGRRAAGREGGRERKGSKETGCKA